MHAQLKQRWIQALRSDKYNQGRGHLRTDLYGVTFHCAMGVLYDLIATPQQWERLRLSRYIFGSYLPIESYDETGLDSRVEARIAALNDQGVTFTEIADLIERDLQAEPDVAQYVTDELVRIAALPPPLPLIPVPAHLDHYFYDHVAIQSSNSYSALSTGFA